ncbi:hypothetical protein J6590_044225 [Homalodisca vitripennis]|nr:hypothetical protein J6590_044225 [Homalodisca vitripennis]
MNAFITRRIISHTIISLKYFSIAENHRLGNVWVHRLHHQDLNESSEHDRKLIPQQEVLQAPVTAKDIDMYLYRLPSKI